ncbi:DUF5807 family protein [Haladaptatus caseinilyticus]|uniref:DUF5807 family protein n=1 Tax=Haladaptatus caseinilyticus TaxID=2993314 RepID=UPI00224B5F02|nr:DUF5807 family protein [Haladaptatus caseinilyticus]
MSDGARAEFLAGERPDDVALFLADSFVSEDSVADYGESVPDGTLLIVSGETGRSVFQKATGMEAMNFAKQAMGTEGEIADDLSAGECPDGSHDVKFVFAFAEEQNEDVGGLYAEGDVIHAYAYCECGTAFSDKWVAGER